MNSQFSVSIGYACRSETERKIIDEILKAEEFTHKLTPKKKYLKFFNMDEFDNFMMLLKRRQR